jgi:hypothetical protein
MTVEEVLGSLETRKQLTEFAIAHQGDSPDALQAAFLSEFQP